MRSNTVKALIFIVIWGCSGATLISAQTSVSQDVSRLQNEIKQRLLVDRDDSILGEDKEINRAKLEAARTNLRPLLQRQLESKRKLRTLLGASISAEEVQGIENLEAQLRDLEKPISSSSSANTASAQDSSVDQPVVATGGS